MVHGRVHVIRQGDCLASLAALYGFASARDLYDHPDNADLRQRRPSPHVLAPGDVVHLPPLAADPARPLRRGSVNRFRAAPPRISFRVYLRDPQGRALANMPYELSVAGGRVRGTTDGDGLVEQSIAATAMQGTLVLLAEDGTTVVRTLILAFGHLDPVDTPSGVRVRLRNLGHSSGDETAALAAFQRAEGLAETGEIDDDTRAALRNRHRC